MSKALRIELPQIKGFFIILEVLDGRIRLTEEQEGNALYWAAFNKEEAAQVIDFLGKFTNPLRDNPSRLISALRMPLHNENNQPIEGLVVSFEVNVRGGSCWIRLVIKKGRKMLYWIGLNKKVATQIKGFFSKAIKELPEEKAKKIKPSSCKLKGGGKKCLFNYTHRFIECKDCPHNLFAPL